MTGGLTYLLGSSKIDSVRIFQGWAEELVSADVKCREMEVLNTYTCCAVGALVDAQLSFALISVYRLRCSRSLWSVKVLCVLLVCLPYAQKGVRAMSAERSIIGA